MELNIKQTIVEPKIYSVLVRTDRGDFLYMGANFSLDDAFLKARKAAFEKFYSESGITPQEVDYNTNLWCKSEARDVMKVLLVNDPIVGGKEQKKNDIVKMPEISAKNELMKLLIENSDKKNIKLLKNVLTKEEMKYIEENIDKKTKQ